WRARGGVVVAIALLLLVVLSPGPAAPASNPEEVVRIGGLASEGDGSYSVYPSPPRSRAGRLLGAGGFTVSIDGQTVASTARPRVPADLGLALVVHTDT